MIEFKPEVSMDLERRKDYSSVPLIEYWEGLARKEYEYLENKQGIPEVRYVTVYVGHLARTLEDKLVEIKLKNQRKRQKHRRILDLWMKWKNNVQPVSILLI